MLAAIRPDDWNLPLVLHLAGAMILLGTLIVAAATLLGAAGGGAPALAARVRFGYRTLLMAVLPSYLVMRVTAQWLASEQDVADKGPTWVNIGFAATEGGFLLLIAAIVVAGVGARRLSREPAETSRHASVAGAISALLLAVYVVLVWVMTAKPD